MLLKPFRGYLEGLVDQEKRRLRCSISAAALTAAMRASLPGAPMIAVDANVPGAGKGKMARGLAMLATGRLPSILTEGHSGQEMEKRLAAAILSGAPAILIDNAQRILASSTIESGLTEGMATIREFGTLKSPTVACSALLIVTANECPPGWTRVQRWLSAWLCTFDLRRDGKISARRCAATVRELMHEARVEMDDAERGVTSRHFEPFAKILPLLRAAIERREIEDADCRALGRDRPGRQLTGPAAISRRAPASSPAGCQGSTRMRSIPLSIRWLVRADHFGSAPGRAGTQTSPCIPWPATKLRSRPRQFMLVGGQGCWSSATMSEHPASGTPLSRRSKAETICCSACGSLPDR